MGKKVEVREKRESWVPTKLLAEIVGTSVRNVNYVRSGKRGKRSLIASKVRYAEKSLEKKLRPEALTRCYRKDIQQIINTIKETVNSN